MQKYLITADEINDISDFLEKEKTLEIKKILRGLERYSNPIIKELRSFIINKGRSTILKSEIQEIIDRYEKQ